MTQHLAIPKSPVRALLATVAVIAAFAAPPASAATGPTTEGAGGGCTLQCIEKALVTTTASSAKVAIETSVPTKVVVTVRRLSRFGRIDGPAIKAVGTQLVASRTLYVYGLDPKRRYWIGVEATDTTGHTASRNGKFWTREAQTAGLPAAGDLSSGLGCSVKCITKAVPVQIGPTAALFEVGTSTPARITVIVSPAGTGSIASISTSPARTRTHRHTASPLQPGTRYDLRVRATDAQGRTEAQTFSFQTVERKAKVTFWKIQVIEDGDPGPGRGELGFGYWVGGTLLQEDGYRKVGSGDMLDVSARGTSRPGLSGTVSVNGASPQLDVRVHGEECDSVLMKNCTREVKAPNWAPSGGDADEAVAGGLFQANALATREALPAGYAALLPEGHDRYLVFETTQYDVEFRVFATVDFFYAW